jgi:hypothetical protein
VLKNKNQLYRVFSPSRMMNFLIDKTLMCMLV